MLVGLKVHARPLDGDTLLLRVTVPPAALLTVMVEVPVAPARMVTLVGFAVRLKTPPTLNVTVAE